MPVGSIVQMAKDTAVEGHLLCDGTDYAITAYPELAAYLGTSYNTHRGAAPPAAGRFRVPDFRGLALVGGGGAGSNPTTSAYAVAATGGEEDHTLVLVEIPSHQHYAHYNTLAFTIGGSDNLNSIVDASAGGPVFETDGQGGSTAHNNRQPYGVVFHFIKT